MIKFKALRENVNEALKNPYKGKPERDLKRKLASFESQLQDLIKKSRGRQRREIEGEIRDMETKVQQVKAALKEDVNEALSGLRGKDGKTYKVDVMKSGRKIQFKITNQFGDFKTINLKQAAKLFEEQDLEKLQADD